MKTDSINKQTLRLVSKIIAKVRFYFPITIVARRVSKTLDHNSNINYNGAFVLGLGFLSLALDTFYARVLAASEVYDFNFQQLVRRPNRVYVQLYTVHGNTAKRFSIFAFVHCMYCEYTHTLSAPCTHTILALK